MRDNKGRFVKGNNPWSKGLTKKEDKRLISVGKFSSIRNKGKKQSKEQIEKRRIKLIGHKTSESTRKKISESNKGKKLTEEHKEKLKNAKLINPVRYWKDKKRLDMIGHKWNLGRKQTEEHIRKVLRRREKSSLEIKFENIINKLNFPYKFVGNGKFFIGRKCPDFINLNEKIAIEVYYRKHKEMFREGGLNGWMEERIEIFNKEGWRIIFFDETQVNEENIKHILGR